MSGIPTRPTATSLLFLEQILPAALFMLLLLSGCRKEEVIGNNQAPPDQTIEDVTISNYVNRVYISVLGRQADSSEKTSSFSILRSANMTMASRLRFLDSVFTRNEYYDHLYTLSRIDLLNNLDTNEIAGWISIFQNLLNDSAYISAWDQARHEIERLDSLRQIPQDLHMHTIGVASMNRRCVNNYFYDQINMGTENFVVSCFQHFLNRYPTGYELAEGKKIVDGQNGLLFLQSGQSKDDFIRIFFNSTEYFEGLASILYTRFLFRNPNSTEMNAATVLFSQTHDYEQMQKNILSSNEYIFR